MKKLFITLITIAMAMSAFAVNTSATSFDRIVFNTAVEDINKDLSNPSSDNFNANDEVIFIDGHKLYRINCEETTEDDVVVVSSTYTDKKIETEDLAISTRNSSGSNIYYADVKSLSLNTTTITYWVSGYFSWNSSSNYVTISNASYGVSGLGNTTMTKINESFTALSNQGGDWLGNKYAFARYQFDLQTSAGSVSHHCKAYIECNVNGEIKDWSLIE